MVLLFFRTLVIYIFILFIMRFTGKRQLGELQPADLASTMLISNLASIPIEQPELPFLNSLVPILLIACLEIIFSFLGQRSPALEHLFSGRPITVIRNGVIDQAALSQMRFSVSDLVAALRSKDIFSPQDVSYAVIETNGTLSACRTFAADTPTREDLEISPDKNQPPVLPFILNGEILTGNLEWCGKNTAWLEKALKSRGLCARQVFLFLGDGKDLVFLVEKEKSHRARR